MYKIEDIVDKIHCADCIEFLKQMPDKSVDLILTDPPYGIGIAKTGTVGVGVKAKLREYTKSDWDNKIPDKAVFDDILRVSKKAVVFGGNYFTEVLPQSKCWICWDKGIPKNFTKAQMELAWTNSTTYSRVYKVLWHGMIANRDTAEHRVHPTQKPLKLIKSILQDFSKEGDVVMDCYLGSGTTAVACKELRRRFIGVEISGEYCKTSEDRLKQGYLF